MIMMCIAAVLSGFLASLGVGGGMILIIYLTIWGGYSQTVAQGVNLLFFIPAAVISVIIHGKNGLISLKELIVPIIVGAAVSAAGCALADNIGSDMLGKLYGGFLILLGLKEIFFKDGKKAY